MDASLSPQVAENNLEWNSLVCENASISYCNAWRFMQDQVQEIQCLRAEGKDTVHKTLLKSPQ